MVKVVEAVYEGGVLKPLEKLSIPNGVRMHIRIECMYGLLKDWKIDAQKLKDELRGVHG